MPAINAIESSDETLTFHSNKQVYTVLALPLLNLKNSSYRLLAFIVLLPVSQMVLFCLAIGHYPVGLPLAVVNNELGVNNTMEPCTYDKDKCPQDPETYQWNLTRFSCQYLDFLSKKQSNLVSIDTYIVYNRL